MGKAAAERSYAHRSRIDKIGAKPGMRVVLTGVTDALLLDELAQRGATVAGPSSEGVDIVFLQIDDPKDLARFAKAAKQIHSAGFVWLITPRGTPGLKDVDVIAAGKAGGLVDVKVTRFNDTHTALKFMVPKDKR